MLKISLLLAATATICLASFVPVSPYKGQHSHKCGYGMKISGVKVNNKLFTFGGCYPIPYIVDPDLEDGDDNFLNFENLMGTSSNVNVSDTIQVYDFQEDTWSDETSKTPLPWRKAELQVVNNRYIYAHSAFTRPASSAVTLWKYDIETKEWSQLSDLPFLWHGVLKSCAKGDKVYFGGDNDGVQQNIIHVYDTKTQNWGKPVILSKKMNEVQDWICGEEYIHFFAKETEIADLDNVKWNRLFNEPQKTTYSVFNADYSTGITTMGPSVTGNYKAISHQDKSFYLYDTGKNETIISKLNVETSEHSVLDTIPYTLILPLIVPHGDDLYFFGGGEKSNFGLPMKGGHVNEIKNYNHKLGTAKSSSPEVSEEHKVNDNSATLLLQE